MTLAEQVQRRPDSLLFNIQTPMWKYVLRMWLFALIPMLILIPLLILLAAVVGTDSFDELFGPSDHTLAFDPAVELAGMLVLAPVGETLLLALGIWILSKITKRRLLLAVMSAFIWAGLHLFTTGPVGAGALLRLWPFFLFSCSYLAWRRRSWLHAFWAASLLHALHNLIPAIIWVSLG